MDEKRILEELPGVPEPMTEHLAEPAVSEGFPAAEHLPPQGSATAAAHVLAASEETEDAECMEEARRTDPLLALVGTLECDFSAIELAPRPRMRVREGSLPAEIRDSDPLLALIGTLECDVPNIGERHDEYIGDALIAELRGDDDE